MKREPPDDDVPWRTPRKRAKLPAPLKDKPAKQEVKDSYFIQWCGNKCFCVSTPGQTVFDSHSFLLDCDLISVQESTGSDALQGDCLDFLVNFCTKVKDSGLLEEVFPETENKVPAKDVVLEGAKPKVAPPLKLDGSLKPPEPKGPPPMVSALKAQAAASSKHAFQLPSAPDPAPCATSSQGRLVVSPDQMKQFLYGTNAPSSSSTSQSVSWHYYTILFVLTHSQNVMVIHSESCHAIVKYFLGLS